MISIEHIDAIARAKNRDVVFITFTPSVSGRQRPKGRIASLRWEENPVRTQITKWLEANNIAWMPCADVADIDRYEAYAGQIYVDLPFDESLPAFQNLSKYMETPEGTSRFKDVRLCCCPLDISMKNAHHDAPGFWTKWAENF